MESSSDTQVQPGSTSDARTDRIFAWALVGVIIGILAVAGSFFWLLTAFMPLHHPPVMSEEIASCIAVVGSLVVVVFSSCVAASHDTASGSSRGTSDEDLLTDIANATTMMNVETIMRNATTTTNYM